MQVSFNSIISLSHTYSREDYDRTPIYISQSEYNSNKLACMIYRNERYYPYSSNNINYVVNLYYFICQIRTTDIRKKLKHLNQIN